MSESNVDSLLKKIASDNVKKEVDESYSGVDETMKHTGRPTNNMLLSVIHSEVKRNADDTARLNARFVSMDESISDLFSEMKRMCSLMETQNEILSSMALMRGSQELETTSKSKQNGSGNWHYQGTKLTSKYHVYACIIFHLINMVEIHMDVRGLHYPDSVDCDFNTMQNAVRVVSIERCKITSVEYKNTIQLKEKDSQPIGILLPHIASSDKSPVTLSESMLPKISNQITRGVMQEIEWIRQRLCHLDGILSIKQIDIMKSIRHPVVKSDSDSELNWDHNTVRPRSSHPLAKDISSLLKLQKDEYMRLRMAGHKIEASYNDAKEYSNAKSKK